MILLILLNILTNSYYSNSSSYCLYSYSIPIVVLLLLEVVLVVLVVGLGGLFSNLNFKRRAVRLPITSTKY